MPRPLQKVWSLTARRSKPAVAFAPLILAGVLAACGGDSDDADGGGFVDLASGAAPADVGSGDDAGDADDVVFDGEIDDAEELDAMLEQIDETPSMCDAIPLDDVTALFAGTIGALPQPLAIRQERVDECAYAVEGETDGTLVTLLAASTPADQRCTVEFGTEADAMIEGLGDGLACRRKGSYRSSSTVTFRVGEIDYDANVATDAPGWDGDVLGRSDQGWALVEGVAALAVENLT